IRKTRLGIADEEGNHSGARVVAAEEKANVAARVPIEKAAAVAPIPGRQLPLIDDRADHLNSPDSSECFRSLDVADRTLETSLRRGRECFERVWVKSDPRSHGGDGLGPVFNGSSCVACHHL